MNHEELVKLLRDIAKSKTRREEGEDWRDCIEWQAADAIASLRSDMKEAESAISDLVQLDSPGEYNQGVLDAKEVISRLIAKGSSAAPAEAPPLGAHLP